MNQPHNKGIECALLSPAYWHELLLDTILLKRANDVHFELLYFAYVMTMGSPVKYTTLAGGV